MWPIKAKGDWLRLLFSWQQGAAGEREEKARARWERKGANRAREGWADAEAEADRGADAKSTERYGHHICKWPASHVTVTDQFEPVQVWHAGVWHEFFIKFFHTCVCLFCRARGTDSQSSGVRAGEEASKGGGGAFGEGEADSRRGQSSAGSTGCRPDEEPWTAGTCNHSWTNKQFSFLIPSIKGLIDTKSAAENRQRFFVVWHGSLYIRLCFHQAAELAEFTAKIALLEDAKRKKEEEATEWQHKVRHRTSISANVYIYQGL